MSTRAEMADTSVLIAASVRAHPRYMRARIVLDDLVAQRRQLVVSAHSLLEMYAGLSVLPVSPRLTPEEAQRVVDGVAERARVVALTKPEYMAVIESCSRRGLVGGIVYDALHAAVARKEGVARLWTFNRGDFERAWPEGDGVIAEP